MRAVVQRVSAARVTVGGQVAGEIGPGLAVLLGVRSEDSGEDIRYLAEKIANLRIFEDEAGKMNRSLLDTGGAALVVSQFTLYGDVRKGRRPSFTEAAPPEVAEGIYTAFVEQLRRWVTVETGVFQVHMVLSLDNDGPVTLILDSGRTF